MTTHPAPHLAPSARRAALDRALQLPATGPDRAQCALCAQALPPPPAGVSVVVLAIGPTVAARCICEDCVLEHVALAFSIQAHAAIATTQTHTPTGEHP